MTSRITESVANLLREIIGGMLRPMTAILAFCLCTAALSTSFAQGDNYPHERREIWLAGEDPVVQEQKHKHVPADYMELFKPDAPWPTTASRLKAFKISTQIALHGTDEQLLAIINDLRKRHIALAVEMGLIVGSDSCGKGVEGYGNPNSVEDTARHIKSLGGTIEYVAMDEPVWFGHIFGTGSGGRVGCQYPLAVLADQIASKIALLRRYFPNIQVGDIEPVNPKWGGRQSIDDIVAFENLLRQRTGGMPAFVHTDMAWAIPGWQPLLENLATRLHANGIRVGVICDGDANVGGDEAWVRQALQRCHTTLTDPSVRPDDLVVQTWEPLPTKMLPETDPGALTYEAVQVLKMAHVGPAATHPPSGGFGLVEGYGTPQAARVQAACPRDGRGDFGRGRYSLSPGVEQNDRWQ